MESDYLKMKKNILFKTLLILMLLTGTAVQSASADTTLSINVDEAIERALSVSEDVKIQRNDVQIKDAQYKEVKSAVYPQLDSTTSWTSNVNYPSSSATIDDYDVASDIGFTQLLWAFGRVSSAIDAAEKYIKIGEFNQEMITRELVYNVKLSYASVLLAQKNYDILNESFENAKANKAIMEKSSSAGRIAKKDNIKISSDIATRIPEVNDAKARLSSTINTLKRLIGVDQTADLVLSKGFDQNYDVINVDQLKAAMLSDEPFLQALKTDVDLKADIVDVRRAGYLPEISLFSNWTYQGSDGEAIVNGHHIDQYGTVGVKVTVPLWEGGKKVQQLKQARLDQDNAQLNYEKNEKDFMVELMNMTSEYNHFIDTLKANNEAVELVEESFMMSQDLLKTGQISLTDLNDAELTLTYQKLSRELTLYNLTLTLAKIEKLTSSWRGSR